MYDLILERKKSKKDNDYFILSIDLGHRKQALTFDTSVIVSILDITERALYESIDVNEGVEIGKLDITFDKE